MRLLLDEMCSDAIAQRLRSRGHDVLAVVADPSLSTLPDDQVLAAAAESGRALVTANIRDFVALDRQYKATGQTHAVLVLVSTKSFPQNRTFPAAVTRALEKLLQEQSLLGDIVVFL